VIAGLGELVLQTCDDGLDGFGLGQVIGQHIDGQVAEDEIGFDLPPCVHDLAGDFHDVERVGLAWHEILLLGICLGNAPRTCP